MADKPKKTPKGRWNLYNVSGGKLEKKNKSCPKCGEGTLLSAHKDRATCGKCGYMEAIKTDSEKK
jgi:small subunit ribosomal protein S27Ae|tara:strand:- start:485 stop:679 length:195 start_codon:yes stop_codon:yes gene_type:complete